MTDAEFLLDVLPRLRHEEFSMSVDGNRCALSWKPPDGDRPRLVLDVSFRPVPRFADHFGPRRTFKFGDRGWFYFRTPVKLSWYDGTTTGKTWLGRFAYVQPNNDGIHPYTVTVQILNVDMTFGVQTVMERYRALLLRDAAGDRLSDRQLQKAQDRAVRGWSLSDILDGLLEVP